jgi:hypothetical protein
MNADPKGDDVPQAFRIIQLRVTEIAIHLMHTNHSPFNP